ncbi:MAG: 2-oxo acid dehydrogenase subunit E2 [Bacteroidales bacterium]|nr:2-oxo acid dehydrogenase subunit E2 [Bacteroidales bacterium]
MKYIFNFPDIGEGLEEGTIVEWLVKKGQKINSGDILVTMETDKVVAEIPSPKNGIISDIYGKIGEIIKVGEALVEIELEEDESTEDKPKMEMVEEEGAGVVGTLELAGNSAIMTASAEGFENSEKPENKNKKALATPVARAMAKDFGVDINKVIGTGPAGRVMKKDIQDYYDNLHKTSNKNEKSSSTSVSEDSVEIENLTQIRKTIALNMIKSKHNAAHMTLFDEVEISELVRIREKFKNHKEGLKLTYLPFILKAVAISLKKHKSLNSEMDLEGGRLIYKKYYNIGVAVDTERGLVVPVIRNVDKLSITDIAEQLKTLIDKAANNQITLDDMKGGTFSVTSYGSIGGKFAVPVINYPQAAILGIGKISQQPIVKNGELAVGTVLPLSISVDHRIVDGGEVTRFINTLSDYLSEPASLIIE